MSRKIVLALALLSCNIAFPVIIKNESGDIVNVAQCEVSDAGGYRVLFQLFPGQSQSMPQAWSSETIKITSVTESHGAWLFSGLTPATLPIPHEKPHLTRNHPHWLSYLPAALVLAYTENQITAKK